MCFGYDNTEKYWLCKNSWGLTGMGKMGLFKIGYGEVRHTRLPFSIRVASGVCLLPHDDCSFSYLLTCLFQRCANVPKAASQHYPTTHSHSCNSSTTCRPGIYATKELPHQEAPL
jgi:hypothetical protein